MYGQLNLRRFSSHHILRQSWIVPKAGWQRWMYIHNRHDHLNIFYNCLGLGLYLQGRFVYWRCLWNFRPEYSASYNHERSGRSDPKSREFAEPSIQEKSQKNHKT
jgi:hypothetical protein